MTYSIDQYDPSIFDSDGEQPAVHVFAVSGNQYLAQYDEDAGYFFVAEVIHVADRSTLAEEIPGRIYEPLEAFEFYRYPGTPVTIREILNSPAIRHDSACASEAAEILNREGFPTSYYNDEKIEGLMKSIKVDVNYDGRRGAQVAVFYYHQAPFMVTSTAGRDLDDVQRVWFLDESITHQVAREFTPTPEVEVIDIDATVNLAYGEGCPVKLGDRFWGTERPDSGRDD